MKGKHFYYEFTKIVTADVDYTQFQLKTKSLTFHLCSLFGFFA